MAMVAMVTLVGNPGYIGCTCLKMSCTRYSTMTISRGRYRTHHEWSLPVFYKWPLQHLQLHKFQLKLLDLISEEQIYNTFSPDLLTRNSLVPRPLFPPPQRKKRSGNETKQEAPVKWSCINDATSTVQ